MSDYVPMNKWGKDHWSTLAYIETVMVEVQGFQVGFDARMRQKRRTFRVMHEQCPQPKRPSRGGMGIPMEPKYGSRLNDGTSLEGHDDWDCVQDMAVEGLFTVGVEGVEPGATLQFSEKGLNLAQALRKHKIGGGVFGNFQSL